MFRGIARDNLEYDILRYLDVWDLYNVRYDYPKVYKKELDKLSSSLEGQLELFKLALIEDDIDVMSLLDKIMVTHLYESYRDDPYNDPYKLIEQLYDMLLEESTLEGRSLEALVSLLSYSGRIFKVSPSLREWRTNEYDIASPMYNEGDSSIAQVLTSDAVVDNISPTLYFIYSLEGDDMWDNRELSTLKIKAITRIYENLGHIPEAIKESSDEDQEYIDYLNKALNDL